MTGDSGPAVIRIIKLNLPTPERLSTPHDGRFVKEYDAQRDGDHNLIKAHLVTTDDPTEAQQYPTGQDAANACSAVRWRPGDRAPRKPIMAYTLEILFYEDAVAERERQERPTSS